MKTKERIKTFKEHDTVKLIKPGMIFPVGTAGTIVHVYSVRAYEVEFFTPECKSLGTWPVMGEEIE
jgi:hypothetical protein